MSSKTKIRDRKRTRGDNSLEKESGCSDSIACKLSKRMKSRKKTNIQAGDRTDVAVDANENVVKLCIERLEDSDSKDAVAIDSAGGSNNKNSGIERQDFVLNFASRKAEPIVKTFTPLAETSKNLMHFFQQFSLGRKCSFKLQKSITSPVLNIVSNLKLHRTASPFDRRVTALDWHPTNPNIVAVGSKGGDIILWDTEHVSRDKMVQGEGAGGSCQALKFWPWDDTRVVSASIDGTVTLHDFEGLNKQILADTLNSYDFWYCSVDVNEPRSLVAAGRNVGEVRLMSKEGKKVFEFRLHKQKVTHVEFSPREDWLLCTGSLDHTVQLWDIRMLKDRSSSLCVLKHDKGINSAYFSQTDGCRLLTTDQGSQIRIYKSPSWHMERTIHHTRRFFQHMSPFKATWHPLQDLIVVGRYPDPSFQGYVEGEKRTIDILDADTGNIITQLRDSGVPGLTPLNKFNRRGDTLASGMGFHILLWVRNEEIEKKRKELMTNFASIDTDPLEPSGSRSRHRQPRTQGSREPKGKGKDTKTKTKEKTSNTKQVKTKLKTKTTKK